MDCQINVLGEAQIEVVLNVKKDYAFGPEVFDEICSSDMFREAMRRSAKKNDGEFVLNVRYVIKSGY